MQSSKRGHPEARVITPCMLLVISIGLSSCSWWENLEPGENFADAYGEFAGFCGFLQDCGNHGNSNRGGGQTAIGSSGEPSSGGSPAVSESAARGGAF